MKRDHTRLLRHFSLLILLCCSSLLTNATCVTHAQWTYTNPLRDSVVFTAADTNAGIRHVWVFGDGAVDSVSGIVARHVYANAGTYQVCQYVSVGVGGCPDTLCQSIVVNDTCHITAAWTYTMLGNDSVSFVASDTNSAATHIWKFGDGTYAFGVTRVGHRYTTQGYKTVCFFSTRGACQDSVCQTITVTTDTCGLLADWTYFNINGDTVSFSSNNNDPSFQYTWNFGDGTYASGATDTMHVYASAGFYNVCLYLHKPGTNCYDTVCGSVAAGDNPCGTDPSWTYYTHGGDSARFTAVDTNSRAQYQWNFGDGTFVTGVRTVSHTYAAPGTYHACFFVYIPGTLCSDSFCSVVTVSSDTCGLTAAWHAVNLGGDSLRFIAADTSTIAIHTWDFGDGTTATGSTDTVHTFPAQGTYHVCFHTYIPGTGCADSVCLSVVAGLPPCPVRASWTAYPLGGDSVRFVADDTVSSATHVWNFGDGTFVYGSTSVTHTFATAASYQVCFYAYELGTSCSDSLCRVITIATDTCHITSVWNYSILGGDSASFTAADTVSGAHHVWNFGDGSSTDATSVNHTYSAPGTYHVCLYVFKTGTACSDSLCQDVSVTAAVPCHYTAQWTSTTIGNDSTRFLSVDTNSQAQHLWSFGDGSGGSGTNLIHHYASSGTYTVCLYVGIPGTLCYDSVCRSVVVTGTAACHITAAWTSNTIGNDSVRFLAADTNHLATHVWHFGDGQTASGTNVIHHYASAGTYTVCFYSYIAGTLCSDTVCQSVVVTGSTPCPISQAWTYTIVGTDSVLFTAADTNHSATHSWSFGDATTGSGTSILHHYATRGNYNVCFYVSIPGTNCSDTLCQALVVGTPCNISSAWTYHVYGDSLSCIAADTNRAADHIWTLNGNTIVNGTRFNQVFQAGGTYYICLNVSLPGTNCIDSLCQSITVSVGIHDLYEQLPSITVMPNPFNQYTVVNVDGDVQPYEMTIYDLVGKAVRHELSAANTFNIQRGNLASGMYMYEVQLKGKTVGKGKMIAE
jgi:PKD repeat protein